MEIDENIFKLNQYDDFKKQSIYLLFYHGEASKNSMGKIKYIDKKDNYNIYHTCITFQGSSGCPIINLDNNRVIGIHKGSHKVKDLNLGTIIKQPIKQFYEENKNNKNNNYIISVIEIKEEDINKDIRIINSFEQSKLKVFGEQHVESNNEKEIKDNCQIKINNELIPFNYYHKFNKKGKFIIEYYFKNNMNNISFLFFNCSSLIYIDLSNFNTQNMTNISFMFFKCSSLSNIDLSNFDTKNATHIDGMFIGCNSLLNIDLSNFNTQNVINMRDMFYGCHSLTKINLSNFNTQKATDMRGMFEDCSSLSNIDLSNFNTQSAINMSCMFSGCSSLLKINLSNFNTQKVTNMSALFSGCSSLLNIDLSNFNTQNVTNMSDLFSGCSSFLIKNILTKDKNILN